jgi:hypothetical protein
VALSANAPARVSARERERRAVDLRIAGYRYEDIGRELGVTKQAAHQAIARAMERTAKDIGEQADALRALEAERLDAAARALWPAVAEGDVRAQDTWLRNRARYAALLGLDLKPEINVNTGPEIVIINTTPPWEKVLDGETVEVPQIEAGGEERPH